jgi:hypothetical protein
VDPGGFGRCVVVDRAGAPVIFDRESPYLHLCDLADVRGWRVELSVGRPTKLTMNSNQYRALNELTLVDGTRSLAVGSVAARGLEGAALYVLEALAAA